MMTMIRIVILILILPLSFPVDVVADEQYTFDPGEIEKKPYHFGGYLEFKPVLFGLDHDAAFYKLRFYNDPQGQTLPEWNGRVQLEGSYEKELFRLYAKTNTDLKYGYNGSSEKSVFYEAYGSLKPSTAIKLVTPAAFSSITRDRKDSIFMLLCGHRKTRRPFSPEITDESFPSISISL